MGRLAKGTQFKHWEQEMAAALEDNVDIIEVFSPPRVTKYMKRYDELDGGIAFDLRVTDEDDGMPWDLNSAEKRSKVWKIIREKKPLVIIGSP